MAAKESIDPLDEADLMHRIEQAPLLAFSQTSDRGLIELLNQENVPTSQMAEMISGNRPVAVRILRAVNSAYYGLVEPVRDLEEAILYIGLAQVRRIVLASPVLEDPGDFGPVPSPHVRVVWRHALAAAILTHEIIKHGSIQIDEENSYLAGLLHDVGHLVMNAISPERFEALKAVNYPNTTELLDAERSLYSWDHARIGAHYLRRLPVSTDVVEAVAQHHTPESAQARPNLAATVSLAEELARRANLDGSPKVKKLSHEEWTRLPAWTVLFPDQKKRAHVTALRLQQFLPNLPDLLNGLA